MEFICLAIITAFMITGIHVCCWQGGIAYSARNELAGLLTKWNMRWAAKPLYDCLRCMSSFWGFSIWLFNFLLTGFYCNPVWFCLCVCGMLSVVERIVYETPAP